MKHGVGAIIENDFGDILIVEEKETKESYSKYKGDLSIPFGTVGDNIQNEDFVDALYREILEETGLDLSENKYLPCELGFGYLENIDGEILFKVKIFHIKLNGVLKKYEEKILNNEIEDAYFISKKEFEEKIKKGGVRAGADFFYEAFLNIEKSVKSFEENNLQLVVGPGSKYEK